MIITIITILIKHVYIDGMFCKLMFLGIGRRGVGRGGVRVVLLLVRFLLGLAVVVGFRRVALVVLTGFRRLLTLVDQRRRRQILLYRDGIQNM